MKTVLLFVLAAVAAAGAADRPNILWITLEDTSPQFIGAYGNPAARTPNLDRLAARGIRFTRAFAPAPVCSSARSSLITGVDCFRLGTSNHRSAWPIPTSIRGFPAFLREAGYHTTNNAKTDYATSEERRLTAESWHRSSPVAGWWQRQAHEPFFAVFNYLEPHQSRVMTWPYAQYQAEVLAPLRPENRVAEDAFAMPPFLPDTADYRQEVARIYNGIALADQRIGELLARLQADGLADDTIIFCYADHGEAIPRGKANPIGLGYRVPFIVVFPEKWQHLNPWGPAGTVSDELITFVDLAPTLLSLAGVTPPAYQTGRALLGTHRRPAPAFVFGGRNRIDEAEACSRTATDGRYVYTRHFLPSIELKRAKYFEVSAIVRSLRADFSAGRLTPAQAAMMLPEPTEVLYDLEQDPWEMHNLAGDPAHAERLSRMRVALREHIISSGDVGLLPEYELGRLAAVGTTPYAHGQSLDRTIRTRQLDVAEIATRPLPDQQVLAILRGPDAGVLSYWAAVAVRLNAAYDRQGLDPAKLSYPPAQIELAAARYQFDHDEKAAALLRQFATSSDATLRLHALQRIQAFGERARAFTDVLKANVSGDLYDPARTSAEVTLHLLDGGILAYPTP